METGATAEEIIGQAITLAEGGKIVIRCGSYDEMESLRTNLYKVRKALLKTNRALARMLWISRETRSDGWFVLVTKEKTVSNIVIIDKDGSVRPFERPEASMFPSSETEDQRIMRLMREDGKTEEEIAEYFAEKGEMDFDAAASKIEELQGLTSQDDELELDVSKKRQ